MLVLAAVVVKMKGTEDRGFKGTMEAHWDDVLDAGKEREEKLVLSTWAIQQSGKDLEREKM